MPALPVGNGIADCAQGTLKIGIDPFARIGRNTDAGRIDKAVVIDPPDIQHPDLTVNGSARGINQIIGQAKGPRKVVCRAKRYGDQNGPGFNDGFKNRIDGAIPATHSDNVTGFGSGFEVFANIIRIVT